MYCPQTLIFGAFFKNWHNCSRFRKFYCERTPFIENEKLASIRVNKVICRKSFRVDNHQGGVDDLVGRVIRKGAWTCC